MNRSVGKKFSISPYTEIGPRHSLQKMPNTALFQSVKKLEYHKGLPRLSWSQDSEHLIRLAALAGGTQTKYDSLSRMMSTSHRSTKSLEFDGVLLFVSKG